EVAPDEPATREASNEPAAARPTMAGPRPMIAARGFVAPPPAKRIGVPGDGVAPPPLPGAANMAGPRRRVSHRFPAVQPPAGHRPGAAPAPANDATRRSVPPGAPKR